MYIVNVENNEPEVVHVTVLTILNDSEGTYLLQDYNGNVFEYTGKLIETYQEAVTVYRNLCKKYKDKPKIGDSVYAIAVNTNSEVILTKAVIQDIKDKNYVVTGFYGTQVLIMNTDKVFKKLSDAINYLQKSVEEDITNEK